MGRAFAHLPRVHLCQYGHTSILKTIIKIVSPNNLNRFYFHILPLVKKDADDC